MRFCLTMCVWFRVWCLFECEKTAKHKCTMDVCFSDAERTGFVQALKDDHPQGLNCGSVLNAFSKIDASQAEATKESDRKRILDDIEQSVEGGVHGLGRYGGW